MTSKSAENSKFKTGYWGSYLWDHYKKSITSYTFFQIPTTVAIKLSNPHLPEEMQSRTIARVHKGFVVIHSTNTFIVLIENHDGKHSLVLIERSDNLAPGIWHTLLDVPTDIARYWLKTPAKQLLSHELESTYSKLDDQRSLLFDLINLRKGLRKVAGDLYSPGTLALHRKDNSYTLLARKARG